MGSGPNVCIVGGTISGNRGAEAMVTTCIGYLRRRWPDVSISILSYFPATDAALIRDERITIIDARPVALLLSLFPSALLCWLTKALGFTLPDAVLPKGTRQLRRSHLLLDVFGISFSDGRELFLPFNVLSLAPAFLLDVPVVKMAQAMGPFRNPLNRVSARSTLRLCAKVFARGDETARHLSSLGVPPGIWDSASDLAFVYEPSFALTQENSARVSSLRETLREARAKGTRIIGLCPSSVVYKKARARNVDYIATLAGIVERSLRDGRDVLVLPHATREGLQTLRNNDLPVLELLKRECSRSLPETLMERIHWTDFDINSADIRGLLQLTDLLITSRFHAMVAALSLGIPPLVLGWSHKYREVLRSFDLEHSCFDIDNFDLESFSEQLERIAQPSFRETWRHEDRLAAVQGSSIRQLEYVANLLDLRSDGYSAS